MKKRTYRILIILAAVVVLLSISLAIGMHTMRYRGSEKIESSHPSNSQPVLPESSFEIHFFDKGEADSALVACDGHYMLIDGGNPGNSSFLFSYLQKHGIDYLDYIVCSHPHTDHVGGLAGALNYAAVGVAYCPVTEYDSRAFSSFVKYLSAQDKTITIPSVGQTVSLGSAKVTFVGPIDMTLAEQNENNASLIIRIEYGQTSFLFTGDAEIEEELSVVHSEQNIQSTLLKVGHHGSYTSSSGEFLKAVSAEYAIISVGKDNGYGHPHEEAMNRIQKYCQIGFRTDIDGEIICRSNGKELSFN